MSVPNIEAFNKYKGNGLSTEFSVSFPYNDKSHVKVYLKRKDAIFQETLEENLDYEFINDATIKFPCTLTREVEKDGQTIIEEYTNQDILQEGDKLAIYRETPLESNYNFKNQVRLFPSEVTDSDDLSILLAQELYAMIQRALIMDQTSDTTPIELVEQVGKYVEDSRMYSESAAASAEEAANLVPYIDNYIENTIKPMMDSYSVQILEQTLENSTKPSIDNYIENEVKPDIYEYAQTEGIQPIEQAAIEVIEKIKEEGGLGRFEVGDIGISPFVDEGKNLRRLLNGQVILQSQFAGFATKLKKAVQTYPNLATTEDNWQAIKSNSKIGQVGKFVIDDTAGTIRLPRIVKLQGLLDLSNIGSIVEDGLPSITHTHTRGTMNITGSFASLLNANSSTSSLSDGSGAFYRTQDGTSTNESRNWDPDNLRFYMNFDASRSWTGSTSNNSAVDSVYGKSNTVQEEAVQYPYFIQVANGYVEDVNIDMVASKLNNDFSNAVFPIKGDGVIVQSKNENNLTFRGGTTQTNGANLVLRGKNADYPGRFTLRACDADGNNSDLTGDPDGTLFWHGKSIAAMGMPSGKSVDLSLGSSGATYTAPANGCFYIAKVSGKDTSYFVLQNSTKGYSTSWVAISTSNWVRGILPVQKGDVMKIEYNATGSTQAFKFYYAEGDNV